MDKTMKLPTFLIIGVEKSGTTSVYDYLGQHPQVYMSPVKETNFLERDWERDDLSKIKTKPHLINTFDKYCQLFQDVQDEIAIGEVSPNYLFHHQSSIERIRRYVPDAQLIAILRNPAERAYSDYLMHLRDEIGRSTSLSEQLKYKADTSYTLLKGLYYNNLTHFYSEFDSSKLKVCLYEDLCDRPVEFMQDMYGFIGVDDSFRPDMSRKAQVAQVPKNRSLNKLLRQQNPIRSLIAAGLRTFLSEGTRQKLRSTIINLNSSEKSQAPLSPDVRKQLVEFYREDVLKLQDLIGRDLSSWLISA